MDEVCGEKLEENRRGFVSAGKDTGKWTSDLRYFVFGWIDS